jgi:hypothetical protein
MSANVSFAKLGITLTKKSDVRFSAVKLQLQSAFRAAAFSAAVISRF